MLLYRVFSFLVLILFLAGCGEQVKYPAPSSVYYPSTYPKTHMGKTKPRKSTYSKFIHRGFISNSRKPFVGYNKRFNGFRSKLCLAIYYLKHDDIKMASNLLIRLENSSLSNSAYSDVYAIMGLVRYRSGLKSKDYFEISYAYDQSNSLAKYMLSTLRPSFRVAMAKVKKWCKK